MIVGRIIKLLKNSKMLLFEILILKSKDHTFENFEFIPGKVDSKAERFGPRSQKALFLIVAFSNLK